MPDGGGTYLHGFYAKPQSERTERGNRRTPNNRRKVISNNGHVDMIQPFFLCAEINGTPNERFH